jgi:hypothetical protein
MIYNRLSTKKNKAIQIAESGLITGIVLIIAHYIFREFLSADSGAIYFLLRDPQNGWVWASLQWMVSSSTLIMLGWTSIIVHVTLAILLGNINFANKEETDAKVHRIYWILGVSSVIIMIVAFPLRVWLGPIDSTLIINNSVNANSSQVIESIVLGVFVYNEFPIFPFAAYGLIGAMIGIALARDEPHKKILQFCLLWGLSLFIVGVVGLLFTNGIQPSYYNYYTAPDIINRNFMSYSQLGLFLTLMVPGFMIFDFTTPEKAEKNAKRIGWLRNYGMISLTVFLFEAFVMIIISNIADAIPFLDGWHNSMGTVAIFGLLNAIVWFFIAKAWKKIEFKGTVEWCILEAIRKLSGKKSEKYDLTRFEKPAESMEEAEGEQIEEKAAEQA